MHIARCRDQAPQTLDEFYRELSGSRSGSEARVGQAMLRLLERLQAWPDERRVYGLTSHAHLCLLAEDTSTSPRYVSFVACDQRYYTVEYLMPERLAPWPNARVTGEVFAAWFAGDPRLRAAEDEALRRILVAMDKSEGWSQRP